jgi:hypothetical protein
LLPAFGIIKVATATLSSEPQPFHPAEFLALVLDTDRHAEFEFFQCPQEFAVIG